MADADVVIYRFTQTLTPLTGLYKSLTSASLQMGLTGVKTKVSPQKLWKKSLLELSFIEFSLAD